MKSFLGNFYRHLATFYWSHWLSHLFCINETSLLIKHLIWITRINDWSYVKSPINSSLKDQFNSRYDLKTCEYEFECESAIHWILSYHFYGPVLCALSIPSKDKIIWIDKEQKLRHTSLIFVSAPIDDNRRKFSQISCELLPISKLRINWRLLPKD